MMRASGILLPVSALPSDYGIGDFGRNAFEFVKLLKQGGFKLWQILPLNPLGYGHSPYQPFSSYAIDELYFDIASLTEEKLEPTSKINYEEIAYKKHEILYKSFMDSKEKDHKKTLSFLKKNEWVKAWSLFMMLKRKNAMAAWHTWPKEDQEAIDHDTLELTPEREYEIWVQMKLYEQWMAIKKFANRNGIRIIGDVPFYVGFDSCDVYANQDSFLLDEYTKEPTFIAGVPPDYFSADGQRWGNPIYNWDLFEKNGFSFLFNRLKGNASLYGVVRLDHFRAFDTFWKIPSSCPTAKEGEWIEAPGHKFFDLLKKKLKGTEIIAEDLGELRPEVYTLRDAYDFPGMNVLEFTFEDVNFDDKKENMVAYIGTHDNDPFEGFASKMSEEQKEKWLLALKGYAGETLREKVIDYLLALPAKYAILSMQDVLGLGSEARLNTPSIINSDNWTWKMEGFESFVALLPKLKESNKRHKR
ncbi:MAG: 4-alpha-glucanotransferase [Bacilli bacterium]|nr:4-alpha-glucanotransferase [Bacilli bacterium]